MLASDTAFGFMQQDPRWEALAARVNALAALKTAALPDSHVGRPVAPLPPAKTTGTMAVEQALAGRRSIRSYTDEPLTLPEVSQLLWAAYGVTKPIPDAPRLRGGLKTAPSAGGRYPLEVYLVAGNVTGLASGVYSYRPENHSLWQVVAGDRRAAVDNGQGMVEAAPATIVYSAVYERTTSRYGTRGRERYVCMDLGHSAENVYLQAAALGLGTCALGAFVDMDLKLACNMTKAEEPLYIMPVGRPAQ